VGTFIKLLEDNGLCVTLGEQILREACMQAQNWRESGLGDLCLAVNVSVKQLMQPKFVEFVDSVLKASGFPAKLLELEITEHTIMENIDRLSNVLASLRDRGVRIAIDDFGTGYSSFMLLKSLPFDVLKIDQAFVRGPVDSELNRAIRAGLVCTARGLNRASVAEGVEDFQMIRQLAKEGCDRVQGFAVSAAIAASEIPLFIAANGNKDGVVVAG
jgi:EAL domain-containing protein (putative c-di-GMP-specific phosphodiesterase class I)